MEFVHDLQKDEYEAFVRKSSYGHFMQSYDFGEIRSYKNFQPRYVGIKKEGNLVCSALLLEKKMPFGYSYFYSPRGYVIDFEDRELVTTFTKYLKDYAKKMKAIFIKMDPALKLHNLDSDGNILEGEDHSDVVEFLKTLGYHHLGFNLGFEHEQPRFTFRISMQKSWEEVYNNIHPTTRKILNKGNQYHLDVYKGEKKDLKDFYVTMLETAKREDLIQSPIEYYELFYETFHKDGLSDLYIVKANIENVKTVFQEKIESVENEISRLENDPKTSKEKTKNKVNDLTKQLEKLQKDLEELSKIKEKEIVLSSIITVKYGDKVWTVHGGNHSILMNLNANYLLYYTILKDAYEEGYKWMDCFGTCGIPNPEKSNPIYGIHSFKKRLGGEYTEFIGEFDYVINKPMYYLYKLITKIRRKF